MRATKCRLFYLNSKHMLRYMKKKKSPEVFFFFWFTNEKEQVTLPLVSFSFSFIFKKAWSLCKRVKGNKWLGWLNFKRDYLFTYFSFLPTCSTPSFTFWQGCGGCLSDKMFQLIVKLQSYSKCLTKNMLLS